MLQLF
jgi:transposase